MNIAPVIANKSRKNIRIFTHGTQKLAYGGLLALRVKHVNGFQLLASLYGVEF